MKQTRTDEFNSVDNIVNAQAIVPTYTAHENIVISRKEALKIYAKNSASFCLSRLAGVASDFGAAYMVSRLGDKYLAASGLITVTNNFVIQSSFVSIYATGLMQGSFIRSDDIDDKPNVGRVLIASYLYSLGLSAIDSVLLSFSGNIFEAIGQNSDITDIVNEYFRAFALTGGVFFTLTSVSSQQTAYALDKPNLVLAVNIGRRLIYLGLAYPMMFGELGFPKLGIAGLAYARTISSAADQLFFILYYRFNKNLIQYGFFKSHIKESFQYVKEFIKTAATFGAQTFNEFAASFAGINFIGLMGQDNLAAAEIAIQYDTLAKIPVLSAAQSTSIEMKKLKNALSKTRLGNIAIVTTLIIPVVFIPILCSAREDLSRLFMKDESPETQAKIIELASTLMIIIAFNQISEVIRNLSAGALRGNGRLYSPLITSILTMSVFGIPMAYALGIAANMGPTGVFLSTMLGSLLGSSILLPYWLRTSRPQTVQIVDENTRLINDQPSADVETIESEDLEILPKAKTCCSRFGFFSKTHTKVEESTEEAIKPQSSMCTIL